MRSLLCSSLTPPSSTSVSSTPCDSTAVLARFVLFLTAGRLENFDYRVLVSVVTARYIMIGITCAVTWLDPGKTKNLKGVMGLHALFTTQSNDVAIGLPIVKAIWPLSEYPTNYPGYLIVISTTQVCLVNPICISILEWGQSEVDEKDPDHVPEEGEKRQSIALKVFLGVATNPMVVAAFSGIIVSEACGQNCLNHGVLGDTFETIGGAYTFCALFLTGVSIHGAGGDEDEEDDKEPQSSTKKNLVIAGLVLGKSLVLPILMRLLLAMWVKGGMLPGGGGSSDDEKYNRILDFGYLYGTLPVAALPVVLANRYNLNPTMIAIASVVSTFAAMPLLIISAVLFETPDSSTLQMIKNRFSQGMAGFSLLATLWLMFLFWYQSPRWSVQPMKLVLMLAIAQAGFSASLLGCEWTDHEEVFYWAQFYFRCAMDTWFLLIGFHLVIMGRKMYNTTQPVKMWILHLIGWLTAAGCVGLAMATPSTGSLDKYNVHCWYKTESQITGSFVSTILMLAALSYALFDLRTNDMARHRAATKCQYPDDLDDCTRDSTSVALNQELLPVLERESEQPYEAFTAAEPARTSSVSAPRISSMAAPPAFDAPSIPLAITSTGHQPEGTFCLKKFSDCGKEECKIGTKCEFEGVVMLKYSKRVKILLGIAFLRLCFLLTLQLQMLLKASPDGSFNAILLFAIVLVDGGGLVTCLTFSVGNPAASEIMERFIDWFQSIDILPFSAGSVFVNDCSQCNGAGCHHCHRGSGRCTTGFEDRTMKTSGDFSRPYTMPLPETGSRRRGTSRVQFAGTHRSTEERIAAAAAVPRNSLDPRRGLMSF
eukprot:TRINITY_DN1674_c0_g1_i1.p1 TRINITY_DN1674_c0_g1~~TRINITY_DN1674_c0_g1_i1.p1  ORF type:complete len:823 (-),score=162.78 TRINITY_DN1674_c0_g1_i1:1039-3507(-)